MSREPSYRLFATELNKVQDQFKKGEDEQSTKFTVLPTGVLANRVMISGVVTDKDEIGSETEVWRATVADKTGDSFNVVAGEFDPEAMQNIRNVNPPEYVVVVGKIDIYDRSEENEEEDLSVSVDAELFVEVDRDETENWIKETAKQTFERIEKENQIENETGLEYYQKFSDEDISEIKDGAVEALENLKDWMNETQDENDDMSEEEISSDETGNNSESESDEDDMIEADEL